jgi:CRP/FNR family cyclic AMP-dependent transcriptional regulator
VRWGRIGMHYEELLEISGMDLEGVLPEDLARELTSRGKRISAQKGLTLIAQGADSRDVYLIDSGLVRFSVASSNGKEIALREMGPGRLFGEMAALGDHRRSANATVVANSVIWRISGAAFTSFLKEAPGAGYWMASILAARLRHLTERYSELAALSVSARLHMELVRMAAANEHECDQQIIFNFPTHEEMAARIGTHREAVTRELRQLERDGLISQSRKDRTLTINSLARLKSVVVRTTQ